MTIDEAAQSLAPEGDAPKKAPTDDAPTADDAVVDAWVYYRWKIFFSFFFLGARYVLGFL